MSTKESKTASKMERSIEEKGFAFIAELSNNHNKSLDRLFQLIDEAQKAGADAIKIQTFSADSLCLKESRDMPYIKSGLWKGLTHRQLYESLEVPLDWSRLAFERGRQLDIPVFSSPFSIKDLSFLLDIGADLFKIASGEFNDSQFIDAIIESGYPFIASVGLSDSEFIKKQLKRIKKSNREQVFGLLNCVSEYPCALGDLNFQKFKDLKNTPARYIGLSDHSLSASSCVLSFLSGAVIFEKHLTLSRSDGGPDSKFSLEPQELKLHIADLKSLSKLVGRRNENTLDLKSTKINPENIENFGRSLYVISEIQEGEILSESNIGSFRPSLGICSSEYYSIIGKTAKRKMKTGDPLHFDDINE